MWNKVWSEERKRDDMGRDMLGFRRTSVTARLLLQLEEGAEVVVSVGSSMRNAHVISYCVRMAFDALPEVEDEGLIYLVR